MDNTTFLNDDELNPYADRECCLGHMGWCPTGWQCPTWEVDADQVQLEVLVACVNRGDIGGPNDGYHYVDPEMTHFCWVCEAPVWVFQCKSCKGCVCAGCIFDSGLCTVCEYIRIRRKEE